MGQQRADFVEICYRFHHRSALGSVAGDRVGSTLLTQEENSADSSASGYLCCMTTRGIFAGFAAATAFFTRIPVATPASHVEPLANAGWAFPLVGAGIGGVAALAFLLAQLLGLGDWPAAVLAVLAGIVLTGALHEDGLADTADGLIGGHDPDHRLAIMRDSRHGTFGVMAIVLSVLLRAAALAEIGEPIHAGLALIAANAASRAALPCAMLMLAPARAEGLGAAAGRPSMSLAVAALAIGLLVSLAALGPALGLVAIGLTGAAMFALGVLARRRIGGYTGDVLGAFQQVGEIVMLLTAAAK
jgi:adenosylcobinamide-GDP ribazoletransferase